MSSFFDFQNNIVYAPGMTCVYNQLFDGVFTNPWKAYIFKPLELGFQLYDKPAIVIENLFKGETECSATLFAEPERFLEENGKKVEYDILVIESRWLFYKNFFFEQLDWNELRDRLILYFDRPLVFLDCYYPHYGYLQNIHLIRQLSEDELNEHYSWQTARHNLLKLFRQFNYFRYISVDALAAYHGYQNACADQPEHYTTNFRESFKNLLVSYSEEQHLHNVIEFRFLENLVAEQDSEIKLLQGMNDSFKAEEIILKLRVQVTPNDPLLCETEMIAIWISEVDGEIHWRQNFTIDRQGFIHPKLNASDETNNKIILKSFDDLVKISTFGRYKFILNR
jgi:hypothetical protein